MASYDPEIPSGGRARGSGGSIHMSFRSGSRAGGASGASAYDYITRNDEYGTPDRDPAIHDESDHMPSWAEEDPRDYWDTADLYERANGRLYVSADFALPLGLDRDEQIALAREFAHDLTDKEQLPYTLAIHAGRDKDGQEHNPHAHLMFSERRNDGIERSREKWFRRSDSAHPERGGAPKSRTFHGREWVEEARERWAAKMNATLERHGRSDFVDHRSFERQGIDREPGSHYGPSAPHVAARDQVHERLDEAAAGREDAHRVQAIDLEITRLEAAREELLRDGLPGERQPEQRDYGHSSRGDHGGDDRSWGR
jgi:MobA/MobL family